MNIKVQCCGIALLALLIIMYNRRRRLPLITGKVFHDGLYVTLICLVLDVASIFAIIYRDRLPEDVPEFICKTYVAFLVMVAMLAVVYVATSVSFHRPTYKKTITACAVVGAVEIGLIYALPITMHHDAVRGLAWTTGASTLVTYVGVFGFIVFNLAQIYRNKQYLYERQRRTVLIWMYMWLGAGFVQFAFNQLLVVGFACALNIMLIFIQFENPELYLDSKTGLYNLRAYNRYADQLYSGSEDFYAIGVRIEDAAKQDMASILQVEIQNVYDGFLDIPGADVFRIQDSEVLMLFTRQQDAKDTWDRLMERADALTVGRLGKPYFYYVGDPRCVSEPGALLELLRYAHRQKESGSEGNFHVLEGSMAAQILAEQATAQMIQDAMDEDRVVVYYQPIYSVQRKCFNSAEALVRIVDREGKLIPPGVFIQVAENNGMIINLGKRVFEKVCQFYQRNQLENYGMEYMEVNLSVVQCADDKLAEDYIRIMDSVKIDPRRINLEITESTSTGAQKTMLANMDRMIDYGVNFSLDDFGTGASNLNYIVEMPVQIVKFDRGMIQAYFESGKAKYVMDAAMQMIHGMGLGIVAEGVETEEQFRRLEEIRINFIQGYYFSKPLPELEFLKFLRQHGAGPAGGTEA